MKSLLSLVTAVLFVTAVCVAKADPINDSDHPFVSPLFSDSMVLQRNHVNSIWGWAVPGSKVTVSFAGQTSAAVAGTDGKWIAKLKSLKAGGPYTMDISGDTKVHFKDILIGDVWICSGQSNMEMGIGNVNNAKDEIAKANYPKIRLFLQPHRYGVTPLTIPAGTWKVCTPDTVKQDGWGGFSAAAYFFGRDLNKQINIPIGLVATDWGGSPIESWISEDSLIKGLPFISDIKGRLTYLKNLPQELPKQFSAFADKVDADSLKFEAVNFNDSDWKNWEMPGNFWQSNMASRKGITWFRRAFDIQNGDTGKDTVISLGMVHQHDTVWVNGTQVGTGYGSDSERVYTIPASVLHAGSNTIVIRLLNVITWDGGFAATPDAFSLKFTGGSKVALNSGWKYKTTYNLDDYKGKDMPNGDISGQGSWTPSALYNGMIAPFVPYGITGAIWYQGESNAWLAYKYRDMLSVLINDWRQQWGGDKFPFYIVQLANFNNGHPVSSVPSDDYWAELRESQMYVAKTVPNTGLAVAADIGDANDIHPKDKQDVGHRLALAALAKHYNQKISYSGPVYKSMTIEGSSIRLSFDHIDGGLVAKDGSALAGFAIAGDDKKFVWADAKIFGDTVIVSSPSVAKPVAVRYAWADNPPSSLYNKANLPAVPFRTDNWPGATTNH